MEIDNIKSVVIFKTGIGDALQLIPLCRELKKNGHKTTGVIISKYPVEDLLVPLSLFDNFFILRKKQKLTYFVLQHLYFYDNLYIEHSASSPGTVLFSSLISKNVFTNRVKWYLRIFPNLTIRYFSSNKHLLKQNLYLAFPNNIFKNIEQLYRIDGNCYLNNDIKINENYITVQISAANMSVKYKNWPINNWTNLIKKITQIYPQLKIVLIGDKNEIRLGDKILKETTSNVISMIGKTSLKELAYLLYKAQMHLGLDSGSMHLASMLSTPTLTIWGPTDPITLGYQVFNKKKNCDISTNLSCHPCKSWIRHNKSLYHRPEDCPHTDCINRIGTSIVFEAFKRHWKKNIYTITQH